MVSIAKISFSISEQWKFTVKKKAFKNVQKLPELAIFVMEDEKVNLHLKPLVSTLIEHVTL